MDNVDSKLKHVLGMQHVFAMFGATILVPIQTGMDPTLALLCAGIGTLIFHLCTKGVVPVFLGSSFAFISSTSLVLASEGVAAVKGGIISTGLVYLLISLIVKLVGIDKVKSFFPAAVNGAIIVVIGMRLAPTAINMAVYSDGKFSYINIIISSLVVVVMILVNIFSKSFFKLVPILIAICFGYLLCLTLDFTIGTNYIDFSVIREASFIGLSPSTIQALTTIPTFTLSSIIAISPIAIVVFIEHIGDLVTNGSVVSKDFLKYPGVHRTVLGDGLATIVAGFLGGPVNTTYSENTGVLAVTKVYDPKILRIAAIYAIILSFLGKLTAIIKTLPTPIVGGISIILFGMIASIGMRVLISAQLKFDNSKNLILIALILSLGIGIGEITISGIQMSGLAIAALVGIIVNKILPDNI
jgi:uracil permease